MLIAQGAPFSPSLRKKLIQFLAKPASSRRLREGAFAAIQSQIKGQSNLASPFWRNSGSEPSLAFQSHRLQPPRCEILRSRPKKPYCKASPAKCELNEHSASRSLVAPTRAHEDDPARVAQISIALHLWRARFGASAASAASRKHLIFGIMTVTK